MYSTNAITSKLSETASRILRFMDANVPRKRPYPLPRDWEMQPIQYYAIWISNPYRATTAKLKAYDPSSVPEAFVQAARALVDEGDPYVEP
jgi:hypothetical protein